MAIIGYRQLLSFGLIYGCGPKVFDAPILDEAIAGLTLAKRILTRRTLARAFITIELLLLYYLLLMSLVGAFSTRNVNTLRFLLIILFLFSHKSTETLTIRSLILGARFFLLSYFAIVFLGYFLHLPVAFWQEGLWTGTAYAAVFSCFSAWLCVLFARNSLGALSTLLLYVVIAVLADSRLQFLLLVVPTSALFARFSPLRLRFRHPRPRTYLTVSATLVVFALASLNIDVSVKSSLLDQLETSYKSAYGSLREIVTGDKEQDEDRKDSIRAALDWASDHPVPFITGSGLMTHQTALANYYPPSGDGKVRPVGISAAIVDGGAILLCLLLMTAATTLFKIHRASAPAIVRLSAALVLISTFLSVLVTNLFDAILFWLIIMPSGVLPFIIHEHCSRSTHRQCCAG